MPTNKQLQQIMDHPYCLYPCNIAIWNWTKVSDIVLRSLKKKKTPSKTQLVTQQEK